MFRPSATESTASEEVYESRVVRFSLDEYLDAWINAAGIGDDKKGPLFRSFKKDDKLTDNLMKQSDVLYMIKRRAKEAGLPYATCCHTFRATGITASLQNGATPEHA